MPVYEYECVRCGSRTEDLREIGERHTVTTCPVCGGVCEFIVSNPRVEIFNPYYSENLDAYITSKKEKRRRMDELGVEEVGTDRHPEPDRDKGKLHFISPGVK